jgi:tRNA 2-thiocytidine biosynthesis protein TtcA
MDLTHPLAVKIRKEIVEAMSRFSLIEEGDRLAVCVSGGKDSSILLALLSEIRRRAPYRFDLEAVILDQKQPGFVLAPFREWVEGTVGIPLHVIERDTYSVVKEKVKDGVYCSLCSRLRRGILYDFAHEKGFTKMALGHHRDDFNQTLLLNLFYTGKMASMPPKLRSDDGRNLVIRPLCLVAEKDLIELAQTWRFPIIPCNLCGSQEGMKRQRMKKLLADLEKEIPFVAHSLIGAQGNIHASQLMDQRLCSDSWLS